MGQSLRLSPPAYATVRAQARSTRHSPPSNVMKKGVHRRQHQHGHVDTCLSEKRCHPPSLHSFGLRQLRCTIELLQVGYSAPIAETSPYCIWARQKQLVRLRCEMAFSHVDQYLSKVTDASASSAKRAGAAHEGQLANNDGVKRDTSSDINVSRGRADVSKRPFCF